MTPRDAAIRHVVDRCPSCGVEHEVRTHACEACDTPLRAWCRMHSHETGWLEGPGCRRCAQEAARRTRRTTAPSLAMPCPAPAPFTTAASPTPASGAGAASLDDIVANASRPRPIPPHIHLAVMFLMLLLFTGSFTLVSVVAAFLYLLSGRGILPDTALYFATYGAIFGLIIGVVACVQYVIQFPTPHRAP
jgi:hypothetical protein